MKPDSLNWTLHCQWGFTRHQLHFLVLHNTLAKTLQNNIWYFNYNLTFLNGMKQRVAFSVVEESGACWNRVSFPSLSHSLPSFQMCWNNLSGCRVSHLTKNQITNYFSKKTCFLFCFVLIKRKKRNKNLEYSGAAENELGLMTLDPLTTPSLHYWSQMVTPHSVLVCLMIW